MKTPTVIVKTVIEIDGKQFKLIDQDFSKSVYEAIIDDVIDNDTKEIIDFVTDDSPIETRIENFKVFKGIK
jgi:hypothetical protein